MKAGSALIELEEQGWRALSSTGEAAARFYESVLDDAAMMLLPGGMVLDERATIVTSMAGQPWSSYELHDMKILQLTDAAAVLTYRALARRRNAGEYAAVMSSIYVRRDTGWKLAFHQQTELPATGTRGDDDGA
jgi:hypothetical protein